ncbi:MAG: glycosyltransferase [Candidatus Omnitrophica bacterium]|nr:glycosyltransferase [Candidatus Omnitrophota bacterium]MBU1997764.1 glycosyltransferase [Candidatus Omnitrophota bacterium]
MIKDNPLISVIMPTYNRSNMAENAAKSVLEQSYKNIELIIIDDGSSDKTKDVINGLSDARIKYIRHDTRKGGSAARNTGIKASRGEYLSFIDDDNLWMPDNLELQYKAFSNSSPDIGIVYVWQEIRSFENNELLWKTQPTLKGNLKGQFLYGQGIGGMNFLTKRECFNKIGLFDEELKACQDWDILKRLSEHYSFDFVPKELIVYYIHQERISTNLESLILGRTRMVEKYLDEFKLYPEVLITHYKRIGKMYCINGTWEHGFEWFRKAIEINMFSIFKIIAWLIIDYPRLKLFSKDKYFKKYEIE